MIRKFFSREIGKLKEMTFAEQRWYIWEYYKLHIIAIGTVLFIGGSLINIWFINPPKQDYLYIPWEAVHIHMDTLDALGERLGVVVPDPERYRVAVRSYVITGEDPQITQALSTRFYALLTTGGLHATITTSIGIQANADFGLTRSTAEVMAIVHDTNPALYEVLTQRLMVVTYIGQDSYGNDIEITDSMGISISGAPLLMELGITMDDLYLGVITNSLQFEGIARALAVMFDLFDDYSYDYDGGQT